MWNIPDIRQQSHWTFQRESTGRYEGKVPKSTMLPENYQVRKEQMEFIQEAARALRGKEVLVGSAPCGIGKSLASLLAVLPQLEENRLMICFRTRSQLHVYLKELRTLSRGINGVSFFSKQDMCPLKSKGDLSCVDFFEECKRLKANSACASKLPPKPQKRNKYHF